MTPYHPIHHQTSGNPDNYPPPARHQHPETVSQFSSKGSAFLLPSFLYIPSIPLDDDSVEAFIKAFVLPSKPSKVEINPERTGMDHLSLFRQPELAQLFPAVRAVHEILILVCGHGGRDRRCGVYGPLLCREFGEKLKLRGVELLEDKIASTTTSTTTTPNTTATATPHAPQSGMERGDGWSGSGCHGDEGCRLQARVATISHVGGHKFAGNVIVYLPPSLSGNALRGKGVWYGRVEPRHVEGIVDRTVLRGEVIRELFRGGVGQGGEVMRL